MAFILGKGVQLVASGIGLASEGITHHKERKHAKSQRLGESDTTSTDAHIEGVDEAPYEAGDEEHWDLDDAQHDLMSGHSLAPYEHSTIHGSSVQSHESKPQDEKKTISAFISRHPPPPPSYSGGTPKLPLPVVLPQRRPKDKSRGFIRAYPPALQEVGIDQAMFLDFIETFDKSTQASPWIQAVNLANFATFAMAPPFSFLVSAAIMQTVKIMTEVQVRASTNTFIDKINDESFRPRGLFCLVMTWNPESPGHTTEVNVTSSVSSSTQHSTSAMGKVVHAMQSSNGNTYGEIAFPEVAPLIFPALDDLASQTGEDSQRKREKIKRAKGFADDYMDRRAVAKYAARNPESVLAKTPKPKFTSRYADPTHPASSGNLISLVTGGHVNPPQRGPFTLGGGLGGGGGYGAGYGGRAGFGRGIGGGGRFGGSANYRSGGMGGFGGGLGGVIGANGTGLLGLNPIVGVKRFLKKRVLYLMIVNLPSDEELAAASRDLQKDQ